MTDTASWPPLTRESVQDAHKHIESYIHRTPVVTCQTLNQIASTPQSERNLGSESRQNGHHASHEARPRVKLFFKCENQQKVGAFKARGAFHALGRLIEQDGIESVRRKGVCTHSSGMTRLNLESPSQAYADG